MGKGFGVWVCFFPFFQIFFKQLFQPLSKSNLLHFFQPFSQIILKTFKATQRQTHAFQYDAQTLGYFLN
jgi:hypothetical protein